MYSSQATSKVNDLRVKSPTKADTDLHNGDFKNVTFFSDSACHHQVSSIISQSSLNYSLNYLINFTTLESVSKETPSKVHLTLEVLLWVE